MIEDAAAEHGDRRLEADAVVVGTGAGGAMAASELARRGVSVLALEEGPALRARDMTQLEDDMMPKLYQDRGARATADRAIWVLGGRCVGGATVHNLGLCKRTPDAVLESWQHRHAVSGCAAPGPRARVRQRRARSLGERDPGRGAKREQPSARAGGPGPGVARRAPSPQPDRMPAHRFLRARMPLRREAERRQGADPLRARQRRKGPVQRARRSGPEGGTAGGRGGGPRDRYPGRVSGEGPGARQGRGPLGERHRKRRARASQPPARSPWPHGARSPHAPGRAGARPVRRAHRGVEGRPAELRVHGAPRRVGGERPARVESRRPSPTR